MHLDYSNLKDDEYQNASKEIGDFITKLGEDSLLVLTNVSGNFFSLDSMKGSRKTGEIIKSHIKKNAIIRWHQNSRNLYKVLQYFFRFSNKTI